MNHIWNDAVLYRLIKQVKNDEPYRQLLDQCKKLEEYYCEITSKLSDEDKRIIDEYIAVCEDMQYRMTQLAYILGSSDNK